MPNDELIEALDRAIEQCEAELLRLKAAKRAALGKEKPGRKLGSKLTPSA